MEDAFLLASLTGMRNCPVGQLRGTATTRIREKTRARYARGRTRSSRVLFELALISPIREHREPVVE